MVIWVTMTRWLIDILINYVSLAVVCLINSSSFKLLKYNSLYFIQLAKEFREEILHEWSWIIARTIFQLKSL